MWSLVFHHEEKVLIAGVWEEQSAEEDIGPKGGSSWEFELHNLYSFIEEATESKFMFSSTFSGTRFFKVIKFVRTILYALQRILLIVEQFRENNVFLTIFRM